jgi:hypothetical protein
VLMGKPREKDLGHHERLKRMAAVTD